MHHEAQALNHNTTTMPLRYMRLAALLLVLVLVLQGIDSTVRFIGLAMALADFLTSFVMAALVATWAGWAPRLAPYVLQTVEPRAAGPAADRCTELLTSTGVTTLPAICVVESDTLIASAVGAADRGLIVVSTGLLRDADSNTLQAILAHEQGHIEGRHMIATGGVLAAWFLVKMLFPVSMLWTCIFFATYLALLRRNEFDADARAAAHVGAGAVGAALIWVHEKIGGPAWAQKQWLTVASTHPTLASRCAALAQIGSAGGAR